MPNPYPRHSLNPYREYEGENNTTYRIWMQYPIISPEEIVYVHRWVTCYGLFRGLPIIPNRSCPDHDCREWSKRPLNSTDPRNVPL